MELRIQRQDSGAVAVLAVYGELDLDGGPQRRQDSRLMTRPCVWSLVAAGDELGDPRAAFSAAGARELQR
jgi:hypothetical protein